MKLKYICALLFGGLLFSCTKNNIESNTNYLDVAIEQPTLSKATKISIGEEENGFRPIYWSTNDEIKLSLDNLSGEEKKATLVEYNGAIGKFELESQFSNLGTADLFAFYPYENTYKNTPGNEEGVFIYSPDIQNYKNNSVDTETFPMYSFLGKRTAEEMSNTIKFLNPFGILRLSIKGSAIINKIIVSSTDHQLSGKYEIARSASNPELTGVELSNKSVTLNCNDGVVLNEEGVNFYIFLPPTPEGKTSELSIDIYTDNEVITKNIKDSQKNRILRSTITGMPLFELTSGSVVGKDYIDEYGINHGQGVLIDGVTWAPVNCGYNDVFEFGKLYQWGRKYGQGYDRTDSKPARVDVQFSPDETFENPENDIFYKNEEFGSLKDWYTSNITKQLTNWDTHNDKIGNPCPDGWQVPTKEMIESLIQHFSWSTVNSQGGYYFSGKSEYVEGSKDVIFFPAAGYRDDWGDEDGRGAYRKLGYYWTSSLNGQNAYALTFYKGNVMLTGDGFDGMRVKGYSVRCVEKK